MSKTSQPAEASTDDVQAKLWRMDELLTSKGFAVTSPDKHIKVKLNGHGDVLSIDVDPKALAESGNGDLGTLILTTINDGRKKAAGLRERAHKRILTEDSATDGEG